MMFAASTSGMRRRHDDRGAVDPILVIASITVTLILLVAGAFNVGSITKKNADDAAKNDLRMLAAAEKAYFAKQLAFTFYDSKTNPAPLGTARYNLQPNGRLTVIPCRSGWVAAAKSSSGRILTRTSSDAVIGDDAGNGLTLPNCATAKTVTRAVAIVNDTTTATATCADPTPTQGLTMNNILAVIGTHPDDQTIRLTSNGTSKAAEPGWPVGRQAISNGTLTNVRIWAGGIEYCTGITGYITATTSSTTTTTELGLDMERALQETGFSDEQADGPIIQFDYGTAKNNTVIFH